MNWISTLVDYVFRLCPLRLITIYPYETGVKFHLGKVSKVCTTNNGVFHSGMHICWIWWQDIVKIGTVEVVSETQFQTIRTKDDVEITMSLAISYKVVDPVSYHVNVMDVLDSLENLCQGTLAEVVSMKTYDDVRKDYSSLGKMVMKNLETKGEDWGVHFLGVNVVNFSRARAIRLLQDGGEGFTLN